MAAKSKNEPNVQCPRKKKKGDYCGIHNRCKKIYRIDKSKPKILINISFKGENLGLDKCEKQSEDTHFQINHKAEFYDHIPFLDNPDNLAKIQYNKLIKSLKKFRIQIQGGSKANLVKNLVNYLKAQKIILQAYDDLSICNNETDFYDFVALDAIPKKYLFIFQCQDNRIYGLDIRSLYSYFEELEKEARYMDKSAEFINPYNRYPFTSETLNMYYKRIEELTSNNQSLKYPQTNKTPEDELYFKVLDVFHLMSSYGYPVNGTWFMKMSLVELLDFYRVLENLWNRHLNLTLSQKKKIVGNDHLFILTNTEFNEIRGQPKLDIQNVLIEKIRILISNGHSRDDRIRGIHYCLMALSEVIDIGEGLPIQ